MSKSAISFQPSFSRKNEVWVDQKTTYQRKAHLLGQVIPKHLYGGLALNPFW
jgi:hypothetical protein